MKTRFALLVTPFLLLFALACSDNPAASKLAVPRGASFSLGTLDDEIMKILALLPQGLETAATTRWANIKSKYAAGLSDPSQMLVAKQMLFELSAWIKMKAPNMDAPPAGETRTAASARAVLYMALYVFNGPQFPTPAFTPTADAVIGLVTPGAPATIVTPLMHAGVALEAGSVAENTIVVISQNPTSFLGNCSGPLDTTLCQWPQFYRFDEFPHTTLLKAAKFSVCHVNYGDLRNPPPGIHDRFRLAHTKPASEADFTPGSTVREGIEILPLISQTFTNCEQNAYVPDVPVEQIGAIGALKGLARRMVAFVTPKTAYAIDQGGGGLSLSFSDFNDVDPGDIVVWSSVAGVNTLLSFYGVWGSSASDVWAMGYDYNLGAGTILHYNGTTWSSVSSGTTQYLAGVWGTSASDVWAVGNFGTILHYNGTSWSSVSSGTTQPLFAVWGTSASDVWAVGTFGTTLHYNGTSWSSVSSSTTQHLYGVWGTSASDVWAVGNTGTITHYNGTSWSSVSIGTPQLLLGVWGTSSSNVWAVGGNGTIVHYNGTSWSSVSSGTTNPLFGVWGTSASDVWAVGNVGTILHYNGTSWSSVSSGTTQELNGVWGTSSSNVWAVGNIGTILLYGSPAP